MTLKRHRLVLWALDPGEKVFKFELEIGSTNGEFWAPGPPHNFYVSHSVTVVFWRWCASLAWRGRLE